VTTKTEKTIEQRVSAEIRRLNKTFKGLDKNKLQVVKSLIQNVAFMSISLEELQVKINAEGFTEEYQNGEHQKGRKQSDFVKIHIAMTRNHTLAMKQLSDLAPTAENFYDELQALRDE